MQKLIGASLLLLIMTALHSKAFAAPLNCTFKAAEARVQGIESLQINEDILIVNEKQEIPLEHTVIKCGAFGRQHRFDGVGEGLQIILKSCTDKALLAGHLIDAKNSQVAEVICNEAQL